MTEALHHLLIWVNAHPLWAQVVLFVTALCEGVFLLGAFIPAAIVIFGMGALVAAGAMNLWSTILIATLGAITGDTFSFWLGRRYGYRLFESRFLQNHPEIVARGRRFFARHGGKGIVLARFLGPIRAVLPSLAGASGMPAWLFVLADSFAGLAWATAYVIPGVVFGASLGLAAEVAGRLAVLLLGLVVLIWLSVWLTLLIMRMVQTRAGHWLGALLDWSRSHRRLGKFGAALADPDQPETPVLALLAALLALLGAAWLHLWASPALHQYPFPIDAAVFQAMRDLQTPDGINIARAFLQLAQWPVYFPVAVTAFVMLLLLRKRQAAAHWAAALAFAAVIAAGLHMIPTLPSPLHFFGLQARAAYAARDLVMATVMYGFIPVLLATGRPLMIRVAFYGATTALLLLIVTSQLYVGAQWYSLAMFSVVMGLAWVALLALGYRRHRPEEISARSFLLPVAAVFVVAGIVQWSGSGLVPTESRQPARTVAIEAQDWQRRAFRLMPMQRQDISGRPKQPLNLQWAAPLPVIEAQLRQAGWQDVTPATALNSLRWLTASTPVDELPVLPQVHAGVHQSLMLRLPRDHDRQYLLRLWPSGLRLSSDEPIWLGSISAQQARSFYRLWRYPVTDDEPVAIAELLSPLGATERTAANGVWLLRSAATPPATGDAAPESTNP